MRLSEANADDLLSRVVIAALYYDGADTDPDDGVRDDQSRVSQPLDRFHQRAAASGEVVDDEDALAGPVDALDVRCHHTSSGSRAGRR